MGALERVFRMTDTTCFDFFFFSFQMAIRHTSANRTDPLPPVRNFKSIFLFTSFLQAFSLQQSSSFCLCLCPRIIFRC